MTFFRNVDIGVRWWLAALAVFSLICMVAA